MYGVFIPIMNRELTDKKKKLLAEEIKRAKATEAMLVFDRIICNDEMLKEHKERFVELKKYLESEGIEVNCWLAPSIGHGGAPGSFYGNYDRNSLTKIKFIDGEEVDAFCPLDDNFVNEFTNTIKAIIETGVEKILFEDDYTLSGGKKLASLGCACDRHMEKFCEMVGEDIKREQLADLLLKGKGNRYRDAWLSLQGDTLREFSGKIEAFAHKINPDVRIGLSANSSSYELEGVAFPELCRIIAGKTRPFARLTGAPYWKNAMIQATNIDAIRLQAHWCGNDIEMMSEADGYPRPRHWIPAAFLENYDMILRADGTCENILKYMIDYTSNAKYETGYIDRHVKNEKHYEEIERRFSGKKAVGLNIFENMELFRYRDFDEASLYLRGVRNGYQPTITQWMMADNSIPTCYGEKDCASAVFGENAYMVTDEMLKNGVILDAQAAKILMEKGIDIGAESFEKEGNPTCEYYVKEDDYCASALEREGKFYNFRLKDKAEVLGKFIKAGYGLAVANVDLEKCPSFPSSWYYENELGQKFMVYSFTAQTVWVSNCWVNGLFRNYYRQKQLAEGIERMQGRPLPAMCYKNPELYILCKKDESSMAVGIWNMFPDAVLDPVIHLDGEYKDIDFYNCSGRLEGNKVILDDDIAPYSFAFFTVYK